MEGTQMMYNKIVETKKWQSARERAWNNSYRFAAEIDVEREENPKVMFSQLREIYFGKVVEPSKLDERITAGHFLFYSPHFSRQNVIMWLKAEIKRYHDDSKDWTRFSWDLRLVLRDVVENKDGALSIADIEYLFDLLVNESVFSDQYELLGQPMPVLGTGSHQSSGEHAGQLALFAGYRLLKTLTGGIVSESCSLVNSRFDRFVNILACIDSSVFEPSGSCRDRTLRSVKLCWAELFLCFYHHEKWMTDHVPKRDKVKEYSNISFNEFSQLPHILELRSNIEHKLINGKSPASVKMLMHWARSPRASLSYLHDSSFPENDSNYSPYVDPWASIGAQENVEIEEGIEPEFVEPDNPFLCEGVWSVDEVINACEKIRDFLHKKRVPRFSDNIVNEKQLRLFLQAQGFRGRAITQQINERRLAPEWIDTVHMVCNRYGVYLGGGDVADEIWMDRKGQVKTIKDVFIRFTKLMSGSVSLTKLAVKEKDLILHVSLESEEYFYSFEYEANADDLLDSIIVDMGSILKNEKMKWALIYEEYRDRLYYLPQGCSAIFEDPS